MNPALKLHPAPDAPRPYPLRVPDGLPRLLERWEEADRRERAAAAAGDPVGGEAAAAEKARIADEYHWAARDLSALLCLMLRHARTHDPLALQDLVQDAVADVAREMVVREVRGLVRRAVADEVRPLVRAVAQLEARR